MKKESILQQKSFELALEIIKLYSFLKDEKREFVLSKQILRSGTSVGANIRESQNAESKADFVHKLHIAQKECDETLYWLELIQGSNLMDKDQIKKIYDQTQSVLKMLKSSILTTKENMKRKEG